VTRTPFSSQKVKGQLVADVLNSQHAGTSGTRATWGINTKILTNCRDISWRPPAYGLLSLRLPFSSDSAAAAIHNVPVLGSLYDTATNIFMAVFKLINRRKKLRMSE